MRKTRRYSFSVVTYENSGNAEVTCEICLASRTFSREACDEDIAWRGDHVLNHENGLLPNAPIVREHDVVLYTFAGPHAMCQTPGCHWRATVDESGITNTEELATAAREHVAQSMTTMPTFATVEEADAWADAHIQGMDRIARSQEKPQ